jgi:hypothetical protein
MVADALAAAKSGTPIYPMPVYLKFAPGGITFARTTPGTAGDRKADSGVAGNDNDHMYYLKDYSQVPSPNAAGSAISAAAASMVPPVTPSNGGGGMTTPRSTRASLSSAASSTVSLSSPAIAGQQQQQQHPPDSLVRQARLADDRLQAYIRLFVGAGGTAADPAPAPPIFLPSLSILAGAAFGRLTGVAPAAAKLWADAMVLHYNDGDGTTAAASWPRTEEEVIQMDLGDGGGGAAPADETTVGLLKRLLLEGQEREAAAAPSGRFRPRPCGYVFKRGDIAWNCRTCQTDSTCVICDNCFRHSDHDGHEVYFHRTTPGGCCDCGDAEAWKVDGCCGQHRPQVDACVEVPTPDDPHEAVRMAVRGRLEGIDALRNPPTALPPRLAATLGVVIGAAVRCLVQAVDGAGIGADPVQWKMRWSDEAARIWNGAPQQEYHHPSRNVAAAGGGPAVPSQTWSTPNDFLRESSPQVFPQNFKLQLRLHNDDVHTFDEVIDALHEPRHSRRNQNLDDPISRSLVTQREAASEMTHHVDADGQVTVKAYASVASAMIGFRRLKSRGLHCAVVSTAQVDAELRARALSSWLAEISAAHPAAAVLVVHALLQINSSQDLGGVAVWQEARSIPAWVAPAEGDEVLACRRRFQAFPPHLASSYVTSDEAEKLFEMALEVNAHAFLELTGTSLMERPVSGVLPARKY